MFPTIFMDTSFKRRRRELLRINMSKLSVLLQGPSSEKVHVFGVRQVSLVCRKLDSLRVNFKVGDLIHNQDATLQHFY